MYSLIGVTESVDEPTEVVGLAGVTEVVGVALAGGVKVIPDEGQIE